MVKKSIKTKYLRIKDHCNVGTIGHVDHGKTTLTAAITRCLRGIGNTVFMDYSDIDSNVAERERGITINATHVEYETVKRHYSHVDCPGHQQYIKHMLTGASTMDGAILVVDASTGPQLQTREHVLLCKEIGLKHIIVYINKLDLVPEVDQHELVNDEARDILKKYEFPTDFPTVMGSAYLALTENVPTDMGFKSVELLMSVVDEYIKTPKRLVDQPFLMSIESVHAITGRGTVVTGKVEQGSLKEGDQIDLVGKVKLTTTCLGVEMFHKTMNNAIAGDNVGILLKNVKRDSIKRGHVLCAPNTITPRRMFNSKVYFFSTDEGGRSKPISSKKPFVTQFFFKTLSITGSLVLELKQEFYLPGDSATTVVNLIDFVPIAEGMRFIMREGANTIGAGVITDFNEVIK